MDHPETPEAVALCLLLLILERRGAEPGCNQPASTQLLDLYVECLNAAIGFRPKIAHERVHH